MSEGVRLFQITETDLHRLEAALPRLQDALAMALNRPEVQILLSECKEIVSNIRWNYGPPTQVKIVPFDPDRAALGDGDG